MPDHRRSPPPAQPRRVLVVVTRRIGDVLLTTPLIRALKRAWPRASIKALVFQGTEGVLVANPDLDGIISVPQHASKLSHFRFHLKLWRRFDIALSTSPSDRSTLYAWAAGRWRAGLVNPIHKERWKLPLLSAYSAFDNLDTHTVRADLQLARLADVEPCYDVVATWRREDEEALAPQLSFDPHRTAFAVLHPYPKFNYKMWHRQGWIDLARWLSAHGLILVLSGRGEERERTYVAELANEFPVGTVNLVGRATLNQLAWLLSLARLYVGPDTAVTHIAAALGVPTIALFGPSNPVKWGPWPRGYARDDNPFVLRGTQRVNNVVLLQGEGDCVPCMLEGCARHIESFSDCLQYLPATHVIEAAESLLPAAPAAQQGG